MASITLNTSEAGTFVVTYTATDKASNTATKNRNVYIKNQVLTPSLELTGNTNGKTRYMLEATKVSSILGEDPGGFTATDQYGNNVSHLVEVEVTRKTHTGSSSGTNTFNSSVIIAKTGYNNVQFNLDQDPQYLLLFEDGNNGSKPALVNGDHNDYHTNTVSSLQASHFEFKYFLEIPNQTPITKTRVVYLTDVTPPTILQSQTSSNYELNADSTTIINTVKGFFSANDTFWDVGSGTNLGFDDLTFVFRDSSNNVVTTLDTSSSANTFTCTATLTPNYTSSGTATAKANWVDSGSQADSANKIYTLVHNISINADSEDPTVTFVTYTNETISGVGTLNSVGNNLYWTLPSSGTYSFSNLALWRKEGVSTNSEINVNDNDLANINDSHISVTYTITGFSKNKTTRGDLGRHFDGANSTTIGTLLTPAAWTATYTVQDAAGNSTQVSRILYIIDDTDPTISLETNINNNTEYLTFGDGLNFDQYSNSAGQAANTQQILSSNSATYSDNYIDTSNQVVEPTVSLSSSSLYPAYPKDSPTFTFFLRYDSVQSHYKIYDFYNVLQTTNINLPAGANINLDLSHNDNDGRTASSLTISGKNLINTTTYLPNVLTNSFLYSLPGNYHSHITFKFNIETIGNNQAYVRLGAEGSDPQLQYQIILTGL